MSHLISITGISSRVFLPGILLAVLGSMAFSGKAIIVKLAYRHDTDAITLLMLRMLFALPLFMLIAWWAGRGRTPLTAKEWLGVVGLGFCGYYFSSILDFTGLAYITASLERLILCLQPTMVLLFSWLLFRRPVVRGQILGIACSYGGVLLVFGQEALSGSDSSVGLGTLLVLLSTLSYAIYLIWSGKLVKSLGALRLVGLASSIAGMFVIAHYLLSKPVVGIFIIAAPVVGLSLINALVCTVLPVITVMMAVERIGPAMAAQVGMVGPIFTILLGVWILEEPFTLWVAAGAVLVISGIFIFSRAVGHRPV